MIDKKPIRKDRVLLVIVILLGVILIPILLRSGGPEPPESPLSIVEAPPQEAPSLEEPPMEEPSFVEEPLFVELRQEEEFVLLEHAVEEGETLSSIASLLGVSVKQIMASNRIRSPEAIRPGETLRVPKEGILHLIKEGQTLTDISLTYAVPIEEITAANGISDPGMIYAGEEILIPQVVASPWENVIYLSKGEETRFIWPLTGEVVSKFGWRVHPVLGYHHHHNGIDIDVPVGTTVYAAAMGKVTYVGEEEGYGTLVILEHAEGYYTAYGHLSSILVYARQFVEAGQPIAESGNSGISSGPHLHFEVCNREFPVDPLRYLP